MSRELWLVAALILIYLAFLGMLALRQARRDKRDTDAELEGEHFNPSTGRFLGETSDPAWILVMAYNIRDYHATLRELGQPPHMPYLRFVPMRPNTTVSYLRGITRGTVFVTESVQEQLDEAQVVTALHRAGLTRLTDIKVVNL